MKVLKRIFLYFFRPSQREAAPESGAMWREFHDTTPPCQDCLVWTMITYVKVNEDILTRIRFCPSCGRGLK